MSKQEDNKAVVGRWFTEFWGKRVNLGVIDEIAAPDMLLKYSLHEPRRGHDDIKAFMTDFRAAFPISISGERRILSPKATMSSVNGKVVAPIRVRPSMTSSSAVSRLRPVGRCTSPAPRC